MADWKKKCKKILKRLMAPSNGKFNKPFLVPIDDEDYEDYIPQPIDLNQIKTPRNVVRNLAPDFWNAEWMGDNKDVYEGLFMRHENKRFIFTGGHWYALNTMENPPQKLVELTHDATEEILTSTVEKINEERATASNVVVGDNFEDVLAEAAGPSTGTGNTSPNEYILPDTCLSYLATTSYSLINSP